MSFFPIDEICTSSVISRMKPYKAVDFAAADYSTEPFWDVDHKDENGNKDGHWHEYTSSTDRDYEYDSIMHYASEHWSSNGISDDPEDDTVHNVPLVRWKQGGPGYKPPEKVTEENAELIPYNTKVSDGDTKGVKALYPWQ